MEVPTDILVTQLGEDLQQILSSLRPALLAYDVTDDETSFFLDNKEDIKRVRAFIERGRDGRDPERDLSPTVRWYLRELREYLKEIFSSGTLAMWWTSHFAIHNRPPLTQSIHPQHWDTKTIAFIKELRPMLQKHIKDKYIDDWCMTPKEILEWLSPINVIQRGEGERIRILIIQIEQMDFF